MLRTTWNGGPGFTVAAEVAALEPAASLEPVAAPPLELGPARLTLGDLPVGETLVEELDHRPAGLAVLDVVGILFLLGGFALGGFM